MTDLETFVRALRDELHSMADEKGYSHQQRMFVLDLGNRFDRALAAVQKPEAPAASCPNCGGRGTIGGRPNVSGDILYDEQPCPVCAPSPAPATKSKYCIYEWAAGETVNVHLGDVYGLLIADFLPPHARKHAELFVRALEAQEAGK